MNSKYEIKSQFDSVAELLGEQLSTLPECVAILINVLITSFNVLFESCEKLQSSIDSLKQMVDKQSNSKNSGTS